MMCFKPLCLVVMFVRHRLAPLYEPRARVGSRLTFARQYPYSSHACKRYIQALFHLNKERVSLVVYFHLLATIYYMGLFPYVTEQKSNPVNFHKNT